jgi:hypothetical protein
MIRGAIQRLKYRRLPSARDRRAFWWTAMDASPRRATRVALVGAPALGQGMSIASSKFVSIHDAI